MTDSALANLHDKPVSRARYEREQKARAQAEALLEQKSRDLFEANRALVAEAETLRSTLVYVETLRTRNQESLRVQSTLFAVLDALAGAKGLGAGLRNLLKVLQDSLSSCTAALIQEVGAGEIRVVATLDARMEGIRQKTMPGLVTRARRVPDLSRAGWSAPDDGTPDPYRSLMVAPIQIEGEQGMALICLSRDAAAFTGEDLLLLKRIARVASEPIAKLRLTRRNTALAALIEGTPQAEDDLPTGLDIPFQSVNRAFERLTNAQALTVDILNDLLTAPGEDVDAAILRALAHLGQDRGSEATFLIAFDEADLHPRILSHWSQDGALPRLPDMTPALPDLAAGEEATITTDAADVAAVTLVVPVLQAGVLVGALGHAMRADARNFLPGEVHLLRSVAHAIHAIRRRTRAEAESRAATEALARERNRLALTLSALPDLLLELDRDGRFVDYHSGGISISDKLVERFDGYLLEEVLPPDVAATGRAILTDLTLRGQADPQVIQFDFGQGPRWLQANAVLRGGDGPPGSAGFLLVLRDITREHEQAQEIARLSEVARRTTNLVFVTDSRRRIVWVNAAFESLTGWTLAEARGKAPDLLLLGARTDPAQVEIVKQALDQGLPVETEILARDRRHVDYWLHLDFQPLRDADGRLTGFMAVGNDITISKAQELALEAAAVEAKAAQARLMAAVGALTDGFALYDAEDRLVLCNERYREIYPKSAAAMTPGTTFEEILRYGLARGEYSAAVGREEAWLADRMRAHRAPEHQMEQELQDGRWLRIFERATPDGGRVGLRVDITALKQAEERALADRSAAMDASMDAIAITDASCRFLYANAAYSGITGATGNLTGQDWRVLFAPELVGDLKATALPELHRRGTWQGDVSGQLADGTAIDVDISLTQRPDGAVLWIMRDLTERRRAESERNRLREDLQTAQRREVIGQLSAGLAHDFNNLIATIAGSAALIGLEKGPEATLRIYDHATRIQRASSQAEGLVRRLLALGARSAQIERIDLAACLREAAELLRPSLPKTIRLSLDLPRTPVHADADPTDVLQLLLNLGLNARDAMAGHPAPPGGHVITLSLAPGDDADDTPEAVMQIGGSAGSLAHARIRITDTGPGLDAAAAEKAFAPYFTSKGSKGSGLGLSIVQSIILSVNGTLTLSHQPGGGAAFTICWPLAAASAPQPARQAAAIEVGARLDGCSVLLVDDSEDVLSVMTAILEGAGAEVAPSTNPAELLEVLTEAPDAFDVIVTDFDMPEMTGADLARQAHVLSPALPVVLVTALPDWEQRDVNRKTRPEFSAVLSKPTDRGALVTTLRNVLGLKS